MELRSARAATHCMRAPQWGHRRALARKFWREAEYLTGLLVAERKNVAAINAEFAQTTDQSCLHRWITQVPWDVEQLNEHRLVWLQSQSSPRYSA